MTNADMAKNDKYFHKCCKIAGVNATKRQASKFKNKKGLAYKIGAMTLKGDKE